MTEQSKIGHRHGENLIFVISQPRSGSTLLQHILASHSQVHTLPEPWLMLHLVYGLRVTGLEAEYNARYAHLALKDFLKRVPDGEAAYVEGMRKMALYVYERALEPSGKTYFLDKTPRYYLIIPELYRIFSEARFVILLRNPLAVLASILHVNLGGQWLGFSAEDRKHDILSAPRLIIEGIEQLGEQAAVVHYEQLVTNPEETVRTLCQRIGMRFEPTMLNYGERVKFEGTPFVDPKSIYKHYSPVTDYLDEWLMRFDSPQKSYIAKAYLSALGRDTINALGYCYDDLMAKLNSLSNGTKRPFVPWKMVLTPRKELSCWSRLMLSFIGAFQNAGFRGAFQRGVSLVVRGR